MFTFLLVPALLAAPINPFQDPPETQAAAELAPAEQPAASAPLRMANGEVYALPPHAHAWPVLLCNEPQTLSRDARALQAIVIYQHVLEGGHYFRQQDNALELALVGARQGGAAPLILDYEGEGRDAAAHEKLASLVRLTRSTAPFRAVGVYGYPSVAYSHADSLAIAQLAIEKEGYMNLPPGWGQAALPRYETELQAYKPPAEAEAPLAQVVDFACPSLYVPEGYGGDPERIYRACRRVIDEAKRWNRPVVAFVSPSYSGFPQAEKGLLPPAEREAVLRACLDGGATPLIWLDNRPTSAMAAAVREMGLQWRQLAPAGPPTVERQAPATRPAEPRMTNHDNQTTIACAGNL